MCVGGNGGGKILTSDIYRWAAAEGINLGRIRPRWTLPPTTQRVRVLGPLADYLVVRCVQSQHGWAETPSGERSSYAAC